MSQKEQEEAGGRRQEAGGRRQEAGGRRQEEDGLTLEEIVIFIVLAHGCSRGEL